MCGLHTGGNDNEPGPPIVEITGKGVKAPVTLQNQRDSSVPFWSPVGLPFDVDADLRVSDSCKSAIMEFGPELIHKSGAVRAGGSNCFGRFEAGGNPVQSFRHSLGGYLSS
jgi:hypothetical protein